MLQRPLPSLLSRTTLPGELDHDGKHGACGASSEAYTCVVLQRLPQSDYVRAYHWLLMFTTEWKPLPHGELGNILLDKGEEVSPQAQSVY